MVCSAQRSFTIPAETLKQRESLRPRKRDRGEVTRASDSERGTAKKQVPPLSHLKFFFCSHRIALRVCFSICHTKAFFVCVCARSFLQLAPSWCLREVSHTQKKKKKNMAHTASTTHHRIRILLNYALSLCSLPPTITYQSQR